MVPDVDPVLHNRSAWDAQVDEGNEWTVPVSSDVVDRARRGDWSVVLIGHEPVDRASFPDDMAGLRVLALAAGGGQQGPVMAATGAQVTVFDNSPRQLEHDQMTTSSPPWPGSNGQPPSPRAGRRCGVQPPPRARSKTRVVLAAM